MRVLGVDPGLSRCGVGIVEGSPARPVAIRAGVVRTSPDEPTERRLATLHTALTQVIAESRPDAVAVERVFCSANVRTAMSVGQAAGIALLCAAQADLPVLEFTPTQVKLAITGNGRADKEQMTFMVRNLLGLAEAPRPADAADALALAMCGLTQARSALRTRAAL